jgi:hypothetical protein
MCAGDAGTARGSGRRTEKAGGSKRFQLSATVAGIAIVAQTKDGHESIARVSSAHLYALSTAKALKRGTKE